MKVSNPLWKERLVEKMPDSLAREVDIFETEIDLRRQGKVEEKLFAETRLRRGVYGQRYDNGHRHDGQKVQDLAYPSRQLTKGGQLTKGPNTVWDAPGMQRIKVPLRRTQCGAAGDSGGFDRGIFRWHCARHDPTGLPTALCAD